MDGIEENMMIQAQVHKNRDEVLENALREFEFLRREYGKLRIAEREKLLRNGRVRQYE